MRISQVFGDAPHASPVAKASSPEAPVVDPALTRAAEFWPAKAQTLVITGDDSYVVAAEMLKGIKTLRAQIAGDLDPEIKHAFEAHKRLKALKAKHDDPLDEAERIIKGRLSVYHAEQARLQREEQERQRRAAQQIEDARRLELAAAMEAEAVAVDDPTLLAEAQAVLDAPLVVAAPVLAPATPSVRGVTYRDTWTYIVRDEAKIPRSWFILDEKRLAAHVRANKDKTDVPGIEAFCEKTVVASAAVQG